MVRRLVENTKAKTKGAGLKTLRQAATAKAEIRTGKSTCATQNKGKTPARRYKPSGR